MIICSTLIVLLVSFGQALLSSLTSILETVRSRGKGYGIKQAYGADPMTCPQGCAAYRSSVASGTVRQHGSKAGTPAF